MDETANILDDIRKLKNDFLMDLAELEYKLIELSTKINNKGE